MGNIEESHNEKKLSVQHKSNINVPTNMFGWLTLRPHFDLTEYWIWTYKEETASGADTNQVDKDGFKRRLTWNSALSANTKMYGLFPITIGRLNAIRHVITPTISFNYSPDFSDPYYGYFQTKSPSGKQIDYLPATGIDQFQVEPIYETLEGWKTSTKGINKFDDLPENAKKYVKKIETFINAKILSISTSPERKDTILIKNPFTL